MNYKISLLVLAICFLSCEKKESTRFSYLGEEMNEKISVNYASMRAQEYEKAASGRAGSCMFHTRHGMVYEDKAEVTLGKDHVHLKLEIREGSFGSQNWIKNTSEEDRIYACKQVCYGNIQRLAASLTCNPKFITVDWDYSDGNLRGTITGEEVPAGWNTQQDASSKGG